MLYKLKNLFAFTKFMFAKFYLKTPYNIQLLKISTQFDVCWFFF